MGVQIEDKMGAYLCIEDSKGLGGNFLPFLTQKNAASCSRIKKTIRSKMRERAHTWKEMEVRTNVWSEKWKRMNTWNCRRERGRKNNRGKDER